LETRPNFHLTVKCFLLINFSNGKQTRENLESGLQKTTFLKPTGPKSPTGRAKSSPPIMMKRSFTSSKLFKQLQVAPTTCNFHGYFFEYVTRNFF
jgi:hypothetical protein